MQTTLHVLLCMTHGILPFVSPTVGTLRKPDFAASAILIPAPVWKADCSVVLFTGSVTSGTLNPVAAAAAIEFGLSSNKMINKLEQNKQFEVIIITAIQ